MKLKKKKSLLEHNTPDKRLECRLDSDVRTKHSQYSRKARPESLDFQVGQGTELVCTDSGSIDWRQMVPDSAMTFSFTIR